MDKKSFEKMEPLYQYEPYISDPKRDITPKGALKPLIPPITERQQGMPLYPKLYRIMTGIRAISSCVHNNAVIDSQNVLWSWGARTMAQMENGFFSEEIPQDVTYVPQKVMENVRSVAAGAWNTMCITMDNKLWGWGENEYGELGLGDNWPRQQPTFIMDDVEYVFANSYQTFILKSDQSLWGWGDNNYGTLLTAEKVCCSPVHLMDHVKDVSSNLETVYVVTGDGTLWGWGSFNAGMIFTAKRSRFCDPIKIMSHISRVWTSFCESSNGFVLTENNELYTLGDVGAGSLLPYTVSRGNKPIKVMTQVADVAAGKDFTFVRLQDGRLFAHGDNGLGQCGTGRSTSKLTKPTLVMTHTMAAAAGYFHGMGLQENGDLWIWGGDYGLARYQ